MNEKKQTKKALIMSVTSMVLCVAMLVGMTFAWFTDTASTSVNKIEAGNLDVQLVDVNGKSIEGKVLNFDTADKRTTNILWEPGCTYELPAIYVKNNGNLALKYKIAITGIKGDAKLNDVIVWTINDAELDKDHSLAVGATSDALTIKGHMEENAGNEYQGLSIDGIAITVYATQDTVENDSYENTYDEKAEYATVKANELGQAIVDAKEGDVIVVEGTVTEPLTVNKGVTLKNLVTNKPITIATDNVAIENASISATETSTPAITVNKDTENVVIKNSVISAKTGKTGTHTAVSIPVSTKVVFTGNTVTNDYNGVEFGLNVPVADGTIIENNEFKNIGNNAISIYQVADGATVTIQNNTFKKVSNAVRLSNSNNATGTFVFANNTVDTDNSWENAFVLLEDYSKAGDLQDFTKYTLRFTGNTLGNNAKKILVYDDQDRIITTNQPKVVEN